MPKGWTEKVETHRQEVREAILDATGELVQSRGLLAVTMSQIAEAAGIGRATLYKCFPDVERVLAAWHERHVSAHLAELVAVGDRGGEPSGRLRAVLEAYAGIVRQRHRHSGSELAAALHRGEPVARLHRQLNDLVADLIGQAAAVGAVRIDVPPSELAGYAIHALEAAGHVSTPAALARLVDLVWAGLSVGSGGPPD